MKASLHHKVHMEEHNFSNPCMHELEENKETTIIIASMHEDDYQGLIHACTFDNREN